MALTVLSNYAANVAHRNLTMADGAVTSSLAKLSSGSRVVSAKDDAASLAIGSRLNLTVNALKQASVNAGQGVSMLQIADGAMAKVNDVLVRMKTLAVQSGSGQLSGTERSMLDTEYQALLSEVTRIAASTEFNGQALVNGSLTTNLPSVSTPSATLASTTNASLGTNSAGDISGTVGAFAADTSGSITVTVGTDNFTASVTPVTTSTGLLASTTNFLLAGVSGSVQGTASGFSHAAGVITVDVGGVTFSDTNFVTTGDTNNDIVAGNAYTFADSGGNQFVLVARTSYDVDAATTALTDLGTALGTNAFLTSSDLDSNSTLTFSAAGGKSFELTLNGATQYDLNLAGTGSLTQGTTTLSGRSVLTDNLDAAFAAVTFSSTASTGAGPFGANNGVTSITGRGLDTSAVDNYTLSYGGSSDYTFTLTDGSTSFTGAIDATAVNTDGSMATGTSLKLSNSTSSAELVLALNTSFVSQTAVPSASTGGLHFSGSDSASFSFKVGVGTDATKDIISVSLSGANADNLGLTNSDITTVATSDAASSLLTTAVDTLNTARSRIGAYQNRLEFAAANISTAVENTEAARSSLMDLDIAQEMTMFTSKQILVQAGVSMLAQANQMPQNLLRLFQ